MAKDEVRTRLLRETISGFQITGTGDPAEPFEFDGQSQWEQGSVVIDGANYAVMVATGYFDLSGYTQTDSTVFIKDVLLQQSPMPPFGIFSGFTSRIVSTEPLSLADFEIASPSRNWALPGTSASSYSLQQIVYGDASFHTTDTTINTTVKVNQSRWGVGNSTAREKLYYAIAVVVPRTVPTVLLYPDTHFVLPCMIAEEPELEYIMRLARSVEAI